MQRRKLRARSGRRRSRRRSCASSRVVRLASFVSTVRTHREAPPRSPPSFFSSRRRPAASPSVPAPAARPTPIERVLSKEQPHEKRRGVALSHPRRTQKRQRPPEPRLEFLRRLHTRQRRGVSRQERERAQSQFIPRVYGGAEQRSGALSRRHGAYGDASSASARAERLSGSEPGFGDASGFGLVSDGISEGSHVSATALRRSSAAYFLSYGDPGYVDAKSARTSHLVHAAHRSPLSSAASASSDDAARAPRTVAPYRPRPSSGSDPGFLAPKTFSLRRAPTPPRAGTRF